MREQSLYRELAPYYDYIYHWKDYKREVSSLIELINQNKQTDGDQLLDVGCGTGHHIMHLRHSFQCIGVDINEEILYVARRNVPDTEFIQSDMIDLDLGRQFDVITCLFGSIGYVKTYANLEKTLEAFSRHLYVGGVVIIEPWFTKADYRVGSPHITTYDGNDLKIARVNISEIDGNISVIDMHYLIAERGDPVKYYVDRHEMGLFEIDITLGMMKKIGFDAKHLPEDSMKNRGPYIGIKK